MKLDRSFQPVLALVLLVLAAGAQDEPPLRLQRITPVKRMAYDWAEQRVVRGGAPQKQFVASFCYVDTDTAGFFTTVTAGTELIDWGIMGGSATTKCTGLSNIVSSFTFAYATSSPDSSVSGPGAALTLTFYTSWKGFAQDSGNCPVATFAFSGLPGFSGTSTGTGTSHAFFVDLTGGFEFCMPDGRFGYGFRGDGNTGPLLCDPNPCTGNPPEVIEIWTPDTKGVGISWFFHSPPFVTPYCHIARSDLSGSPAAVALRNGAPNAPGSLSCTAPELAGSFTLTAADPAGHSVAIAFAFDTPISFQLGGGQRLLCLDVGGNGELLTGGGLALTSTGPATWTSGALPVPKNLDLCGSTLCVQAIFAFGVVPFALSSACDLTIGG